MSLDKVNYSTLLGDNVSIYIYGKTQESLDKQLAYIKDFCYENNIKFSNIYIDTECSNLLKYKTSLMKLLKDNPSSTVLISDTDRLSRDIFDYIEIKNQMFNQKIKFFNITTGKYEFNVTIGLLNEFMKNRYERKENEMQRTIDVLYVEPNKLPVKMSIKNTLAEKQKLVNGNIEYAYIPNCDDVALICNEEGKVLGLPLNRDIDYDIIAGNFIIVADNPELGEDRSLTEEQIEKYTELFGKKSIENTNKKINEILSKDDLFY